MRNIFKSIIAVVFATVILTACTDTEDLAVAIAPTDGSFLITPRVSNVVLNKIDAETEMAIAFLWEKQSYGVDTPVTYTLEMDTNDGDFSDPDEFIITTNEKIFTHAALNYLALKFNLVPNIEGGLKVRLKTNLSYGALPSYSNIETITVTPYETLNLKYPMPAELYLQGDAVPSNWGYPIPDAQKMTQIDNHRFGLIATFIGGKKYAAITSPTSWSDPAYKAKDYQQEAMGGAFIPSGSATEPQWGGNDINSPETTGVYKIIFDYTSGEYTVTPEPSILTPPTDLYIIGDATPLGWAANVDTTQKFTKINDHTFEITLNLTDDGAFAFITTTTYSDPAYKAKTDSQDASGGNFIASGATTTTAWGGSDLLAPRSGSYTITGNFKAGTYTLKPLLSFKLFDV
jgi:hypothetical protein